MISTAAPARRWAHAAVALGSAGVLLALLPTGSSTGAVPSPGTTASASVTHSTAALPARQRPGWGLDRIDQRRLPLDHSYRPRSSGAGVTVYLIDTGLDVGHAQFGGRASIGTDLLGGNGRDCADEQGVGHGTFVAGIVGGATTGVAPRVRLVEVKAVVCGEGGTPVSRRRQVSLVVEAVRWVRRHAVRPAVVNMSLAFGPASPRVDRAVTRLVASGASAVVAAGNFAENACGYSPARVPAAVTVAASDRRDRSWVESGFGGTNDGPCVDLYAPGKSITSVLAGGGTLHYAGIGATSWATPFVTGAAAQYLQRHPRAKPAQVARWLRSHATTGALHGITPGTPDRLLFTG